MNDQENVDKPVTDITTTDRSGTINQAPPRFINITVLFLSISVVARLAFVMGQDISWDLRNYHYYNAYAFLHDRLTLDVAPAMIQSYLNPLLDLLPYLIITHLPPHWLGIIIGGIQGINIWFLFKIAYLVLPKYRDPWRWILSITLAVPGFWGMIAISEIGTTMQDTIISIFILISTISHRRWIPVVATFMIALTIILTLQVPTWG